MKIALISVHGCPVVRAGEKDTGGMNIYLLETAKEFARRGICVDVFTRMHDVGDPEVVELAPGARVIHVAAGPPETDKSDVFPLLDDFSSKVSAYTKFYGLGYDMIWSHYWLSGLVGMRLKAEWNVPHVTSSHTLAELKKRAMQGEPEHPERDRSEHQIMSEVDSIVVWSQNERESLADIYQVPTMRTVVIPPGVDSDRFSPGPRLEARAELGLNGDKIVLFVGRLERLKGVDVLLSAMSMMEDPVDARLVIVGGAENSPERRVLAEHAEQLGISDRVQFHSSVDHDELIQYYRAADVCALPSYYESFGLAALEASSCGTPVVASEVGGLPEIVRDGRTGYLVKWRAPGPFVSKLEQILQDDKQRAAMGQAARQRALELSWERSVDDLQAHFESLIHHPALAGCGAAAG
jgi:D-inositol-3-phosphate glycosyltransferase